MSAAQSIHILPPWELVRVDVVQDKVSLCIETRSDLAEVFMTTGKTDELIRALGTARTEISKEMPKS
jgi:hypothetical protein